MSSKKLKGAWADGLVVHAYIVCWNEEVILPHFLRHYSFCQRIVVYDNESSDASLKILKSDSRVEVRSFSTEGKFNEDILLELRNNAWKESRGDADFVIVCDCDEFLYHPDLATTLQEMKSISATIVLPSAYQMFSDKTPTTDEGLLQSIPLGALSFSYQKSILFDPKAIKEINYRIGSHICDPIGQVKYFHRPGLALLHYKYLSQEYCVARFKQYSSRATKSGEERGHNPHHKKSAAEIKKSFSHFANNGVDVQKALLHKYKRAQAEGRPDDLDQVLERARAAIKNGKFNEAHAKLLLIADWQPESLEVGVGFCCTLLAKFKWDFETLHVLRRTAAIYADCLPNRSTASKRSNLKRSYGVMKTHFEALGQMPLAARCEVLMNRLP